MKPIRSLWTSGRRAAGDIARLAVVAAVVAACNYGFTGGGLPANVETVYIEPLENETVQFGLEQQVFDALTEELPGQLGVQTGGRESADAIISGRVTRYDDAAQNFRAGQGRTGAQVVAHQVRIGLAIQILDVRRNLILWESSGVTGQGTYQPGSQADRVGIEAAIEDLVRKVIDGAQSQW